MNNLFDVYPDKHLREPPQRPQQLLGRPRPSYNSDAGQLQPGPFLYSANQFGFSGAYYFARLNFTLL